MEKSIERRSFFKEAFSLLKKEMTGEEAKKVSYLRPPGAVEEAIFLSLCKGCGDCLKVCPYYSITLANKGALTPIIIPKKSPCYLCEDFPCIKACQSGALRPANGKEEVKIGVARIKKKDCPAWDGGSCQLCVIKCPFSGKAIYLDDFRPVIREESCVGCGICEQVCFTVNDRGPMRVIPVKVKM